LSSQGAKKHPGNSSILAGFKKRWILSVTAGKVEMTIAAGRKTSVKEAGVFPVKILRLNDRIANAEW